MARGGDWPPPSYLVSKFEFTCFHKLHGKNIPLFRFDYVDYPGGYLTEANDEFSVESFVNRAHSILVLLDGQKIYDLLEEKAEDYPSIYSELDKLVVVLNECVGRPVHFLITKSDIFDFKVHPLEKIRDAMLEHPQFRNVVEQICEFGPVHLVPVSAVGPNFAVYQKGEMKRRRGAQINPTLVDLSIGLTMVDYIYQLSRQPDPNLVRDEDAIYRAGGLLWLAERAKWILGKVAGRKKGAEHVGGLISVLLDSMPGGLITALLKGVTKYAEVAETRLENVAKNLKATIKSMTDGIHDKDSALTNVVQIQAALVGAFEKEFPASRLNESFVETSP
jgi:hypothetical protein